MLRVVIQPSYGNPAARRHWHDTLDQEVDFKAPHRWELLTSAQRDRLLEAHPGGTARFWGATKVHDKKMEILSSGDVVLFTGQKYVRGVGEMGAIFRNADFADTLWNPDPANGAWRNVYSLASFSPVMIPYEEIWELPGFNHGDNFMGMRVLRGDKAEEILRGLHIETDVEREVKDDLDHGITKTVVRETVVVELEGMHVKSTTYTREAGEVVARRAESMLVREYLATRQDVQWKRLSTPAGLTDIYLSGAQGTELIEAKSDIGVRYVREALAQLLDYIPHAPRPLDRMTALFPEQPEARHIELLHRYGIGCTFRVAPGVFEHMEPAGESREQMRKLWFAT
ncbi:hypothetical protein LG943_19415 [Streptomonospora sp. S1-112]|uniref:Uncharacterized protein n=1 Tax=Streptomonospora mangrovi TaxID=2883123 RepID=A0A9X3NMI5_9ACTN|nr:hypothetical protein [Streptomonospora mangrovi]MDA0566467.1 hypothetical protein [Streptomonospora mangrovi]